MTVNKKILIYGAEEYIGKLFVDLLVSKGVRPILAGKDKRLIKTGKKNQCEVRLFAPEDSTEYLQDVDIVINLADDYELTQ